MNLTHSLLYLLLLYAVLDKENNLSLTSGLLIGCGILLVQCFCGQPCSGNTPPISPFGSTAFANINGF